MTKPPNVSSLSYEEARDELVGIVARLEAGEASLDESLALWERGEALADRCRQLLEGARDRITAARAGTDEADAADADPADAGVVQVATDPEDAEDSP